MPRRPYTMALLLFTLLAASASLALQLGAGIDVIAAHILAGVLLDVHLDDQLRKEVV